MTVQQWLHVRAGDRIAEESRLHSLPELAQADVVALIHPEIQSTAELVCARVRLPAGSEIPLHTHGHSETVFVLEGALLAQLGRGVAEIPTPGAAYFPTGEFHGLRAPNQEATFLLCYPRGDVSRQLETTVAPSDLDASTWPNPNVIRGENRAHRWALVEESEPAVPVEPTKGWRLTARYLLGPRTGAPDVLVGTGSQKPFVHYTIHRHEPAEIYYIRGGEGIVHVGDESYDVRAGSAVYVPPMAPHGVDTFDRALDSYWVYGLDRCGADWTWEALEPIHSMPDQMHRRPLP